MKFFSRLDEVVMLLIVVILLIRMCVVIVGIVIFVVIESDCSCDLLSFCLKSMSCSLVCLGLLMWMEVVVDFLVWVLLI